MKSYKTVAFFQESRYIRDPPQGYRALPTFRGRMTDMHAKAWKAITDRPRDRLDSFSGWASG